VSALLLASSLDGATLLAIAGALGLVAFVSIERRAPEPLLPLGLFAGRIFAVANAASLVIGAILFGVTIYIPVFVQGVLGDSATGSGVVLIPLSLGWVCASFVSGQLVSRTGRYRVFPLIGSTLVLAGMVLLTGLGADTSRTVVSLDLVVVGIGMGTMFQTYVIATQNAVPVTDLGVATASIQFFRSMGGSLAVAIFGALLTARLPAGVDPDRLTRVPPGALSHALHGIWVAAAALAVAALALAAALEERPLRTSVSSRPAPAPRSRA
jgi:Na+/melibiose symporter-like transporter